MLDESFSGREVMRDSIAAQGGELADASLHRVLGPRARCCRVLGNPKAL